MSLFLWRIHGWCCIQQPFNEPNRYKSQYPLLLIAYAPISLCFPISMLYLGCSIVFLGYSMKYLGYSI